MMKEVDRENELVYLTPNEVFYERKRLTV